MRVSDFFNKDIHPFVLGCFYSRFEISDSQIQTFTAYKKSEKIDANFAETQGKYIEQLNKRSFENWTILSATDTNFKACLTLENDLNLTESSFFNRLYYKIVNSTIIDSKTLTDSKMEFIRGFMETRGSIDTQRELIAQDYFYHDSYLEVKKARLLFEYFDIPSSAMNLNFRQLQTVRFRALSIP